MNEEYEIFLREALSKHVLRRDSISRRSRRTDYKLEESPHCANLKHILCQPLKITWSQLKIVQKIMVENGVKVS